MTGPNSNTARHVKCDEQKPACRRCIAINRECPGYKGHLPAGDLISRISSLDVFESEQERRAFAYFRQVVKRQLSGSHARQFWDCLVLQAAHADVGVRHALIALASSHECLEVCGTAGLSCQDFALKQYNLAIKHHLQSLRHSDIQSLRHSGLLGNTELYLVSCIIFICIEAINGRMAPALSLIRQGVQILRGSHANKAVLETSPLPLKAIEQEIGQLEAQAITLVGRSFLETSNPPQFRASHMTIPEVFSSITEAKDCFDYYYHVDTSGLTPGELLNNDEAERQRTLNSMVSFHKWSTAFDALLQARGETFTPDEQYAASILHIQRLLYSCALDMSSKTESPFSNQMQWDQYNSTFSEMVSVAESLFDETRPRSAPLWWTTSPREQPPLPTRPLLATAAGSSQKNRRKAPTTTFFTLDAGLVAPMYDVACRCRDPSIRRRAVAVLRVSARREGIFDGLLAARIAESVIAMEESEIPSSSSRSCGDIPGHARISRVSGTFRDVGRRKAELCYHFAEGGFGAAQSGNAGGGGRREPVLHKVDF